MAHDHSLLWCNVVCCAMLLATCGVAGLRCKQEEYWDMMTRDCTLCHIPSELEIIISPCNNSHNTVVTCADGAFNSNQNVRGVRCQFCGVCGTGANLGLNYEIRSCSPTSDTKCCQRGNMKIGPDKSCLDPDEDGPEIAGDINQQSDDSNRQDANSIRQNVDSNRKNDSIQQNDKINQKSVVHVSYTHNKALRRNMDYRSIMSFLILLYFVE